MSMHTPGSDVDALIIDAGAELSALMMVLGQLSADEAKERTRRILSDPHGSIARVFALARLTSATGSSSEVAERT